MRELSLVAEIYGIYPLLDINITSHIKFCKAYFNWTLKIPYAIHIYDLSSNIWSNIFLPIILSFS